MTHAMVTFVAPLALSKLAEAEEAIDRLGNPADPEIQQALAPQGDNPEATHFASLHALRSVDGTQAYIVFEFSADGSDDAATARIVKAIGGKLKPVFMLSNDWRDGGDLGAFLKKHVVPVGNGLFGNPGLPFAGTPGFTVGRILFEHRLARKCAALVEAQSGQESGLQRIAAVRAAIAADPDLQRALEPAIPAPAFAGLDLVGLIATGIGQFATTYLWPAILLVVAAAALGGLYSASSVDGAWRWIAAFVLGFVRMGWAAAWVALFAVVFIALLTYLSLRKAEANDALELHSAPPDVNRAMFTNENKIAQNHMISLTRRKPGLVRWFTSRLVFWVIGLAATKYFAPGFLSDIGTIHFARWVTVPGSRDVVFLSNYDGSWESYLEDFITKAHAGLTGVWSNTMGFPRTENLFQLGATDGDRFKRFARHSMVPTRFWYSAYPEVTTTVIRSNAVIRAGLSGAMTEDEANAWLAAFGSAARPAVNLVSSDIQSLIFGGLGFLPFGTCMICRLSTDRKSAHTWLSAIAPDIAYNDGRRLQNDAVLTLALSWEGLVRLGLPAYAGATFPYAFVEGMTQEARSRILGDIGNDRPELWRWGRHAPDAAILIFGRSADAVAKLKAKFLDACTAAGMAAPHEVPLEPITDDKREPFGFADGISQPVIRGTYKSLRSADSIHVVEPGEMVLGYPDNRGYIPPSPTLLPNSDPSAKLPLLGAPNDFSRNVADAVRDVGFNGSFLVIRELEQDVDGFNAYCKAEAERLKQRLSAPYDIKAEYIGAKLVGRWQDGSSLVRHPYESGSAHKKKLHERAAHQARVSDKMGKSLVVESADETLLSRTSSDPSQGAQIAAAPRSHRAPTGSGVKASGKVQFVPDNDFLFGEEDPQALRCPFGAHIRRANPRDSLDPGNADQVAISNRHRIIRVGRHYQPSHGQKAGLLFMALCADIERQFEFLQQTWLKSASFHGLMHEKDPLLGDAQEDNCGFTVPTPDGPIGLRRVPQFVTTKGGGYFFLPGRRLVDYLLDAP
jgi:deferrochelatase/peroxidase EfeB